LLAYVLVQNTSLHFSTICSSLHSVVSHCTDGGLNCSAPHSHGYICQCAPRQHQVWLTKGVRGAECWTHPWSQAAGRPFVVSALKAVLVAFLPPGAGVAATCNLCNGAQAVAPSDTSSSSAHDQQSIDVNYPSFLALLSGWHQCTCQPLPSPWDSGSFNSSQQQPSPWGLGQVPNQFQDCLPWL
jgi:hypothetical protein